ncbi:MAG TPA: thioesterase family protein [Noviherbaspirillum sp.]|jgi:acyl-CoA thioesterase|uniref:acyl-CoA thioesterase n=1 Tax=Noviherbaspirillum sp. TaxID=1926288 RepID=UPI002F938D34
MMTAEHPFDRAIALHSETGAERTGHTSPDYWNAISPFGGTTAATMLQAMLEHPDRLGEPISLTVNFAGAIKPGNFRVQARPARTGRSTQHWLAQLHQGDDPAPAITATAVFALRRDTWSDTESAMPSHAGPEGLERYAPPMRLPFLERYDIRYVDSHPFAGGASSQTQCWIADVPPRPLDAAGIVAHCDAYIPRIFVRRGRPTPIATVTLTVNFHADAASLAERPCTLAFAQARANAFRGGFHDQEGRLWAEDGRLLATTHQMVWFKE